MKNINIQEITLQKRLTEHNDAIEWIPFNKLSNIQKTGNKFYAYLLDGIRIISGGFLKFTKLRSCPYKAKLKTITVPEFKNLLHSEDENFKIYGLTKKPDNNECLIVFDEFGWTSGNIIIDKYIKELQLKVEKYEDVIEWIPFEKLKPDNDDVYKINDEFIATWLEVIPIISNEGYEWTKSRLRPYRVMLKTLTDSQDPSSFILKFKNNIQSGNDEHKVYGITQNISTNNYMLVFEEFGLKRCKEHGICKLCEIYNTSPAWCQTCDPKSVLHGWTSGNEDVDNCIKSFQRRGSRYDEIIEWIPYEDLDDVEVIGEGGFSVVYSAKWKKGKRYTPVTLPISQKDFLKEFENLMQTRFVGNKLEVYGITQHKETKKYMIVFQYANGGNLRKFLEKNFTKLKWESKWKQLLFISWELTQIHKAGYIHRDLHSGNILIKEYANGNKEELIKEGEREIYGVLPYIAPEVLLKHLCTEKSDIYSFGVIMAEMSTGNPPYYGLECDVSLDIKICNGLHPTFAEGTPECYIQLASRCMDANPSNRPSSIDVYKELES
ncbi:kinase-like domain-containing protein [Gigaspora rosea]|uniref:Kinase-like domain-containing protein n=1 Tax=Gigaspora rosea TaxID=44941 RepID=A0A397VBH5_9GLOM|nr:kinase-like domain-containing protein [Gigaspora rosea]